MNEGQRRKPVHTAVVLLWARLIRLSCRLLDFLLLLQLTRRPALVLQWVERPLPIHIVAPVGVEVQHRVLVVFDGLPVPTLPCSVSHVLIDTHSAVTNSTCAHHTAPVESQCGGPRVVEPPDVDLGAVDRNPRHPGAATVGVHACNAGTAVQPLSGSKCDSFGTSYGTPSANTTIPLSRLRSCTSMPSPRYGEESRLAGSLLPSLLPSPHAYVPQSDAGQYTNQKLSGSTHVKTRRFCTLLRSGLSRPSSSQFVTGDTWYSLAALRHTADTSDSLRRSYGVQASRSRRSDEQLWSGRLPSPPRFLNFNPRSSRSQPSPSTASPVIGPGCLLLGQKRPKLQPPLSHPNPRGPLPLLRTPVHAC